MEELLFPSSVFLLEGFRHTRSRFLYGRNLLLCAALRNSVESDVYKYAALRKTNVFFTLFLGYLAFVPSNISRPDLMQLRILTACCFHFLKADYGWRGHIFLLIMYYMRDDKPGQAILGSCWLTHEWRASFAFLSINLYNGKRGFIRGKSAKYFYWFYPVHIIGLVILTAFVFILIPPAPRSVHPSTTNTVASSTPSKKAALSQKCSLNACPEESVSYFFFTISFAFL